MSVSQCVGIAMIGVFAFAMVAAGPVYQLGWWRGLAVTVVVFAIAAWVIVAALLISGVLP